MRNAPRPQVHWSDTDSRSRPTRSSQAEARPVPSSQARASVSVVSGLNPAIAARLPIAAIFPRQLHENTSTGTALQIQASCRATPVAGRSLGPAGCCEQKWEPAEMAEHTPQLGGLGGESMFTCPRCEQQFPRSFLERYWSEWSQVCWSPETESFRQDCMLFRQAGDTGPARDIDSSVAAVDLIDAGAEPAQASTIIGACVGDCALCGDHNRIAIVSSGSVVSRCLRCRDETVLPAPPAWCHMARLRHGSHSAGGPAESADASANAVDGGAESNP